MNLANPKSLSGFLILAAFVSCGHIAYHPEGYPAPFMEVDSHWADTTLSQMTIEEKIGQLFILESSLEFSPKKTAQNITDLKVGGVLIKDVSREVYFKTLENLRAISSIPLLELSDALVSFNNQLSDLPNYPSNASFSAFNSDYLNQSLHRKLIADYKRMGINCTLSPNIQSFEGNKKQYKKQLQPQNDLTLISRATSKVEDLQKKKILSIANAFDIYLDSIPDSTLIRNGFLNDYKPLVISGLSGILIDNKIFKGDAITERLPEFFKSFLQQHLGFDGLIFGKLTEEITLKSLIYAGTDILIVQEKDINEQVNLLKQYINDGSLNESIIDEKVRRILLAKKWLNLDKRVYNKVLSRTASYKRSDSKETLFIRDLFEQSLILANNPANLLPFKDTYAKQFKVVHVGAKSLRPFQNSMFNYANFSTHLYRPKKDGKINGLAFNPIKNGAFVITLDEVNLSPTIHKEFIASINTINESSKVVVINYGNPMNLEFLDTSIVAIQVFECNEITQRLVPQLLFGAIDAKGKLPIEVAAHLPKGTQHSIPITRLKYTIPEEVGVPSYKLDRIEEIFAQAIRLKATPGGQVLIAKEGKIIYSKHFGHHTYDKRQRVEKTDLYDVASITKTAATTLAAMKLYEEGVIELKQPIRNQMTLPSNSRIKNILLKDLFIHKSGLQRNMPIAKYLNNRGIPSDCTPYICSEPVGPYTLEIAKDFYLNPAYLDSLKNSVNQLDRPNKYRKYVYSDVNFYIIHQLIEEQTNIDLDDYLKMNFYQPLGLRFLTYKPLERFPADVIVPTQDDRFWRKNLVQGYVHDEAAALLGGVGGNAGLFANAEDLAILFQMLLNGGTYGGEQFIEKETIDYFTSSTHGNHRGLGFDKARYNYTASKSASSRTYGHSGFTGTCVWVDPKEELVYVFLSNRVHPNSRNKQLKKMKVRQKVHQVIYDAIRSSKQEALTVNMAGE